jgi:hypothetical protein
MNADMPIFKKINIVQDGNNADGNYGVFGSAIVFTRLEEIALLQAEALIALNRGSEAITFFNRVRTSRGFKELSYKKDYNGDDVKLLKDIFEERRKELMGEGWRWYDQIRRQRLLKDNIEMLDLIENKGIYWPVSKDVLDANSLIEQNNYWK